MTATETVETRVPVLIVGGGYTGLAASLFLSHHGVGSVLVDRHDQVSVQGRARAINQRTMEIYRALGVADDVYRVGRPFDDQAGGARCTTLAGEWEWFTAPDNPRALPELTAGEFCMADQNTVEPILIDAAAERGADQRFNTELVSFDADDRGVTAVIEDRATRRRSAVRADYLLAADGARSPIRNRMGVDRPGPGVIHHRVTIVVEADLSSVVRRKAMLWLVLDPEVGPGVVLATAVPGRWAVTVAFDPAEESLADFTPERCVRVTRTVTGIPDLDVDVLDVAGWEQAVGVAESYRSGRVFFAGDSAHVWPPTGGLGANTAVHDAHNLAWKLAAVIKGHADPSLLDSYETERRPIALELARVTTKTQQDRLDDGYRDEFDMPNYVLGQRYRSSAVVDAVHDTAFGDRLDLRGLPGERAPHLWLTRDGDRIAVHDLFHDSFVLLTGSAGGRWADAAERIAERTSVPLRAYRLGAASEQVDLVDVEAEWQTRYGVGTDGAVLVRPDGHVAWRSTEPAAEAEKAVTEALDRILRD